MARIWRALSDIALKILTIQNCEIESFGAYESELRARGAEIHFLEAWRNPVFPDASDFDAILVGGTPLAAYDAHRHPFLLSEIAFLTSAVRSGTPCFGICCGAQLLAHVIGAEVKPNPEKEIGVYDVSLTAAGRDDPLLDGFPDPFSAFQWHGDTFDIPPGADHLAEAPACRNQIFRHGATVGVQFHLEVTAVEAGRWAHAYADELAEFGKSRAELVAECQTHEKETLQLTAVLLDNFIRLAMPQA